MVNFNSYRAVIKSYIRDNENQEIKGQTLQNVLLGMLTELEDKINGLNLEYRAISQSKYDALSDKSGLHFVYPD